MWKRGVVVVVIICMVGSSLIGCESKKKERSSISIGVIFDSFIIERWQRDKEAFETKAKDELGADVFIENANGDVNEQKRLLEKFIDKQVDVIVIVPINSDAVTDAVKRARKQGIKVISYDRLVKNADVDLYITFDNEKVGELMALTIMNQTKQGNSIFMMCGPREDNNVSLVQDGFLGNINTREYKIVERHYATAWHAEDGYEWLSEYLAKGKQVEAIMCGNDGIAGQVIRALSERKLAGNVCVVGQDADLDACQRIVEGTQTMTVYKPVSKLAGLAAEYAIKFAKGEEVETQSTFFDGTYDVPYKGLDPIAITKTNIDLIIQDGFHSREDIYMNIK